MNKRTQLGCKGGIGKSLRAVLRSRGPFGSVNGLPTMRNEQTNPIFAVGILKTLTYKSSPEAFGNVSQPKGGTGNIHLKRQDFR
jgi:hypothetical protein